MTIPIFDGHNDSLRHLYPFSDERLTTFVSGQTPGHIDLTRAEAGGFGGGFFAIFPPADPAAGKLDFTPIEHDGVWEVALAPALRFEYAQHATIAMAAALFRLEEAAQGRFKVVRTSAELAHCLDHNVIAAILHFEGAEAIDPDLEALDVFYQAGLRSLGPVWSRPNAFASGVPFAFPRSPDTGPGLTDAGRALVRRCNELGIMLDVSHLNEQGFWDLAACTSAPIVATHSAVHALCPSTRNLTDRQIDAIGESDGMIGVNFEVSSLRADWGDDPDTPLDRLVDHIDYLVERIGIDRVGFGSDFDGARMSNELGDVAGLPHVLTALRKRGYDEAAVRKLAYQNWQRVLAVTWRQ